jgi:hypothetical protein
VQEIEVASAAAPAAVAFNAPAGERAHSMVRGAVVVRRETSAAAERRAALRLAVAGAAAAVAGAAAAVVAGAVVADGDRSKGVRNLKAKGS